MTALPVHRVDCCAGSRGGYTFQGYYLDDPAQELEVLNADTYITLASNLIAQYSDTTRISSGFKDLAYMGMVQELTVSIEYEMHPPGSDTLTYRQVRDALTGLAELLRDPMNTGANLYATFVQVFTGNQQKMTVSVEPERGEEFDRRRAPGTVGA